MTPTQQVVEEWHRFITGEAPDALERLLADDVAFLSPVVFTPQRGKAVTTAYLQAAAQALGGGAFRYTKQVVAGAYAVLEFETEVDGKHVNGVDVITVGEDGRITEFRVMIRPLQALDAVHRAMGALLQG